MPALTFLINDSIWITALVLLYPVTWVLIPWVLLKHVVHPTARVAWILAIVFLPFVGALATIVFGINHVERTARTKQATDEELGRRIPAPLEAPLSDDVPDHLRDLCRLAKELSGEPLVPGNRVRVFGRSPEAFKHLERAMRAATRSLHVSFYIYRRDRIGTRLRDVMIDKAREGVEVRFMYDELGSWWLTRKFRRQMRQGGVKTTRFLAGASFRARWSLNLRTHRKIVVVDGRVAFTGGLNVGDEYLGRDPGFGYWRDEFVEVEGPGAARLQRIFAEDWFYSTGEALSEPHYFDGASPPGGDVAVQVIPDGPDDGLVVTHDLLFAAITSARERVTVATGYFIPTDALMTALTTAARRGVKVRILTAGKNTYVHTLLAGRSYYGPLLDARAEVYEYQRGLYHAKFLVADGTWWLVGTPNFDFRSLMLNFEDSVAGFDRRIAGELERRFEEDLVHSRRFECEAWNKRGVWSKLGESGCVLLAPVL